MSMHTYNSVAPPPTPADQVPPNYSPPSPDRSNWLLPNQWTEENEEGSLKSLPSMNSLARSPLEEEGNFSWTSEEELPSAAESLRVISKQLDRLLALLYSEVDKSQGHQIVSEGNVDDDDSLTIILLSSKDTGRAEEGS